jgi:hypothetical protein
MGGSMYVRVKRGETTVFLHCQGSEALRSIKARAAEVLGLSCDDMKLYSVDKVGGVGEGRAGRAARLTRCGLRMHRSSTTT